MLNSKGITTKAIVIIIACVIVVGIGGYFGWRIYKEKTGPINTGPIDRVNPNIPADLLYHSKSDEIPAGYLIANITHMTELDTDLIYSKEEIHPIGPVPTLYCRPSNKKAERIEYFYHSDPRVVGGWEHRYAYICGDKYWILDANDMNATRIYGPFERGKEPKKYF